MLMYLVFDFRCTIKTDFKFYEYVHTSCWAEGNQKLYQNILVLMFLKTTVSYSWGKLINISTPQFRKTFNFTYMPLTWSILTSFSRICVLDLPLEYCFALLNIIFLIQILVDWIPFKSIEMCTLSHTSYFHWFC